MHEVSICHNILQIVEDYASKNHLKQVSKVLLQIGELANIDKQLLQWSFPIIAQHSRAKDARLEIHAIAGVAFCNICKKDIKLNQYLDACPSCDQFNYKITQGKELTVKSIGGY